MVRRPVMLARGQRRFERCADGGVNLTCQSAGEVGKLAPALHRLGADFALADRAKITATRAPWRAIPFDW